MKNVWYESFQIRGAQFKKKCFRKRDGDVIHHYYFNEYRVTKAYFIEMLYLLDSIDSIENKKDYNNRD